MDELADKVRMDPMEFRMKNLPPEAPNAMWRAYSPMGAERSSAGQAAPDRRSDARPDQARHGVRGQRWGGGGRGAQAHVRDRVRRQRGHALRHAGHRHRHAHARGDGRRRDARPARRRRSSRRSATRCIRSAASRRQHDGAAVTPAIRVTAGKALDALKRRRSRPALGVEPADLVAGGASRRRDPSKGSSWRDACKLLGTEPIVGRRRLGAGLSSAARAACSSPRSRSTSRPASRR